MIKCGDANPNGNVQLFYKGGCKDGLNYEDAYRCVGCGGWFHYGCILKHFELEAGHDNARNAIRRIMKITRSRKIINICKQGIQRNKRLIVLAGESRGDKLI